MPPQGPLETDALRCEHHLLDTPAGSRWTPENRPPSLPHPAQGSGGVGTRVHGGSKLSTLAGSPDTVPVDPQTRLSERWSVFQGVVASPGSALRGCTRKCLSEAPDSYGLSG